MSSVDLRTNVTHQLSSSCTEHVQMKRIETLTLFGSPDLHIALEGPAHLLCRGMAEARCSLPQKPGNALQLKALDCT